MLRVHQQKKSNFESPSEGKVKIKNLRSVKNEMEMKLSSIEPLKLKSMMLINIGSTFRAPYGSTLLIKDGVEVALNQMILEWDPYTVPIIAEESGTLDFKDLVEGVRL